MDIHEETTPDILGSESSKVNLVKSNSMDNIKKRRGEGEKKRVQDPAHFTSLSTSSSNPSIPRRPTKQNNTKKTKYRQTICLHDRGRVSNVPQSHDQREHADSEHNMQFPTLVPWSASTAPEDRKPLTHSFASCSSWSANKKILTVVRIAAAAQSTNAS